jgi:DNA invertase Pin-like site-specific DNA recombinase
LKNLRFLCAEIVNETEGEMQIGYARVSTDGQTLDAQQASLKQAGAEKVYSEKISGVVTDRRQLKKAIDSLNEGDLLIVSKLDRLARSTRDLLNTIATITDRGAGFKVLDNPAMDTTSAHGRLLLNILGSIAEFERELIRSRTGEGRARAKLRGVRFGRKPALTQFQREEAIARRANGETLTDIARSMNVSHSTISRL